MPGWVKRKKERWSNVALVVGQEPCMKKVFASLMVAAVAGASAFNEDIDSSDDDGDTVDLVDAADTLSPLVSELKGPSVTLQEVLDRVNRTAREAQKAFGSANKVSKQRIADYQTLYLGRKHTTTSR